MKFLKCIFVGVFGLVALLFPCVTGYVPLPGTSDGAPTPQEQVSFEIILSKALYRRSFTLSDLVQPLAQANSLAATPTSAWAEDPNATERLALVDGVFPRAGTLL